ncbi:hypothetical protein [uncultured Desulfovibrio sp.]|uniref:hypothetical protein n=1 Tax=uncultured Desulfovibrio sp. TaxID=167968 RepID=UPI00263733C6|nr:hypothetical protein [uncultured Desulfovibrio sp.]
MSGILGQAAIAPAATTVVYTVPEGRRAVVNISLCNTGDGTAITGMALCAADTPDPAEWIESGTPLAAHGALERTGIVLQAGRRVVIRSDVTGVSASVWGMEEEVA